MAVGHWPFWCTAAFTKFEAVAHYYLKFSSEAQLIFLSILNDIAKQQKFIQTRALERLELDGVAKTL